jgi:hypothetical protein
MAEVTCSIGETRCNAQFNLQWLQGRQLPGHQGNRNAGMLHTVYESRLGTVPGRDPALANSALIALCRQ